MGYLSISYKFYGGESGEWWFSNEKALDFGWFWGILFSDRGRIWSWTLGIWLKEGSKNNCFCDFPWIYLPICGEFFMGKFLWFFLDPWSWDIYGNLWLRNAYTVNCPWNWGWRWTKINIWVPSLEIYPCNIMQLWIAGGSGYVSWECLGQVDLIYTGFMHSRGYEKPMRGGSGNNPGHGVWHYGAVWEF